MDDRLAEKLGASVRAARLDKGLTQAEAAELLGISLEFFGRIERGKTLPSVETLVRVVARVGVSFDAVAQPQATDKRQGGRDHGKVRAREPLDRDERLIRRMLRVLPSLSPRALRAISDLASELVSKRGGRAARAPSRARKAIRASIEPDR